MRLVKLTKIIAISLTSNHNDLLFLTLLTAFFRLLWLGELTTPSTSASALETYDWRKIVCRSSVETPGSFYSFHLSAHKGDRFFEESCVVIQGERFDYETRLVFIHYLHSRDSLFPLASPLWLT